MSSTSKIISDIILSMKSGVIDYYEAIEAIRKLPANITPDLITLLYSQDQLVRELASFMLIDNEVEYIPTALVSALLHDSSDVVRENFITVLMRLRDPKTIPLLISALNEPIEIIQSDIITLLISFGESALYEIIKILPDLSDYALEGAIYIIGQLGSKQNVKGLLPYLDSDNSIIRKVTLEALGNIADADICNEIIKLLKDSDKYVKAEAINIYQKLCGIDNT